MIQKIAITRRWPSQVEQEAKALGEVTFNVSDRPWTRDELAEALCTHDILCPTVTDHLPAELLRLPDRRAGLIANFGVGFNHIDMEAAREQGILVSNTPGVLTEATAEIALNLLLSVARRTGEGERLVREGRWEGWHPTHMLSTQVTGKHLGIVGMGRIGLALAKAAHFGLGMRISYYNRNRLDPEVEAELQARWLPLLELLAQADFVSLHCPANAQTRHLIDADALDCMSEHAFLINTARGDVVDEHALVAALQNGGIAGAGLDVYETEPRLTPGLDALDNVVLLPHMGSGTTQTRVAMGRCVLANVAAYIAEHTLPNAV